MEHFSVNPPPNRTCGFHRIRLSSDTSRSWLSEPSVMDGLVTVAADYQGLSPAGGHVLYPQRTFSLPFFLQVGEFAYVVHLDLLGAATHFTIRLRVAVGATR